MKIIRNLFLLMFSGFVGFISIPVSFFWLDVSFIQSVLIGIGIPVATALGMVGRALWKRMTDVDPYREEIAYVKHQVKEANKKAAAIGACRYKTPSLTAWVKITKLHKVAKGIIKVVEEDPERYKDVQAFFTQQLPAAVTIVERYTFLLKQPVRSMELTEALREAERLMDDLTEAHQQTLLHGLSNDVMSLEIEGKMFKQSIDQSSGNASDAPHHIK
jgi:5-bromo-4-chloroindolyl phosphate hydrolysis protein